MVNKNKLLPMLTFIFLFAIIFTGLIGAITFEQLSPTTNPLVTNESTVNVSWGVHCPDGCSSFTESWNGTNTTLYDNSLVLFYNFDNRSELGENDTFVRDLSMYNNNGTITGANMTDYELSNITWHNNGKYNGAFNFTALSNVKLTTSTISGITDYPFTLSLWAKAKNSAVADQGLLFLRENDTIYYGVMVDTAGVFRVDARNNTLNTAQPSTTKMSNNTWTKIDVVFTNSTSRRLYINGVLDTTFTTNTNFVSTGLIGLIGSRRLTSARFNGSIDDVMIFNRSLSSVEITELYKLQVTKFNESYLEFNTTENTDANSQNYFLCSKNSTSNEFCSATQSVRSLNTISSNFSTSLGIFDGGYGTNTHGSYLSARGDGYDDGYLYYREYFENSGMTYIRAEPNFQSYAFENGTFTYWKLEQWKGLVDYARNNDYKIIWTMSYMPPWLADIYLTDAKCNSSNMTCPPSNYTKWDNLVLDFLDEINCSSDVCEVEVWNEPDLAQFFLSDVGVSDATNTSRRTKYYNLLFNSTYIAVKSVYPDMKVGMSGLAHTNTASGSAILKGVLSNFTTDIDTIHLHMYSETDESLYDRMNTELNYLLANCSTYSANCSNIIIGEFNYKDADTFYLGSPDEYETKFAGGYIAGLNNIPSNISFIQYQLTGANNDYPMLNSTSKVIYPSYNVTKNFAHLCPAGGNVWQHENDGECVKWTVCSKGSMFSIIGSNSCNYSQNYTANLSLTNGSVFYPYTSIMNYETGSSIPVSSGGQLQLGVLDSYDVLYLTSGDEDGASQTNFFKFNEATGTRVYDLLQNVTYGTISGATWVNDSIFKTLTSAIDYTISTSGLLVVSSSYLFNYMNASWSYLATWRDTGSTASLVMVDSLGNSTTFLSILIVISFAVVILTLFKPSVNTNPLGKPHY